MYKSSKVYNSKEDEELDEMDYGKMSHDQKLEFVTSDSG